MSKKDLVSEEVLQELTNKIQEIVNNYCWNLEYFTPTEIEGFFDGSQQEIDYYSSLIKDDVVSKNFLHSSKQIADDIAKSILEANEYTDSLLKNISSIKLEYVTELPTSDISESTIYILKSTDGTSNDTLNLYNTTNGWTEIGDFTIDLTNYIDRTTYDTDMALKANKTEVLTPDDIKTDITATDLTNGDLLGAKVVKDAIDSKANDSDVVKKTAITTTIDNNSTDEQIASARAVLRSKSAIRMDESVNPENYEVGAWFAEGNGSTFLSTSYGHPCSEWHIGYVVTGYEASDSTGYKIILAIAMSGNCYIKVQQWDRWTNWINIGTTSIADTPITDLEIKTKDSTNSPVPSDAYCKYAVTNGICELRIGRLSNPLNTINRNYYIEGIPKSIISFDIPLINGTNNIFGTFWNNGSKIEISLNANASGSFGNVTYTVAKN